MSLWLVFEVFVDANHSILIVSKQEQTNLLQFLERAGRHTECLRVERVGFEVLDRLLLTLYGLKLVRLMESIKAEIGGDF